MEDVRNYLGDWNAEVSTEEWAEALRQELDLAGLKAYGGGILYHLEHDEGRTEIPAAEVQTEWLNITALYTPIYEKFAPHFADEGEADETRDHFEGMRQYGEGVTDLIAEAYEADRAIPVDEIKEKLHHIWENYLEIIHDTLERLNLNEE